MLKLVTIPRFDFVVMMNQFGGCKSCPSTEIHKMLAFKTSFFKLRHDCAVKKENGTRIPRFKIIGEWGWLAEINGSLFSSQVTHIFSRGFEEIHAEFFSIKWVCWKWNIKNATNSFWASESPILFFFMYWFVEPSRLWQRGWAMWDADFLTSFFSVKLTFSNWTCRYLKMNFVAIVNYPKISVQQDSKKLLL